jgi:hypothetical protein
MWTFESEICCGSGNLHATKVKFSNIRQKKLNFIRKSCKINVKAEENQNFPAFIFHFPAETILPSKSYYTIDVARSFKTGSYENKSRKILILRRFDVYFTSFPVSPFFDTKRHLNPSQTLMFSNPKCV